MKILGHPVHLMLNHFPAALFPMECVLYGMFYFTHNASFMAAAFYAAFGGVIMGWLSGLTGAFDVYKIPSTNEKSLTLGFIHGGIQATVIIAYSVIVFLSSKSYPSFTAATSTLLIIRVILVCLLIVGNYMGGNLLLKHKVGIET